MTEKVSFDNVKQVTVRSSSSPKRPYPGVKIRGGQFEAGFNNQGRRFVIGLFPTPEQARIAVLNKQADYLEAKAMNYRSEAALIRRGV